MLFLVIIAYCTIFVNSQCSSYTCVPTSAPDLNCGGQPELFYRCGSPITGNCQNEATECAGCCVADNWFYGDLSAWGHTDTQEVFGTYCQQGKCNTAGPTAQPSRVTSQPSATTLTPSSSPSATTDEPSDTPSVSPSITTSTPSNDPSVTPSDMPSVTPSNMPSVTPSISPVISG
eukprot:928132_1